MDSEVQDLVNTAQRILAGEITPYRGAAHIWRVMAEANYEGYEDLRVWVGLASEWQEHPEDRELLDGDIRDAARDLVGRYPSH